MNSNSTKISQPITDDGGWVRLRSVKLNRIHSLLHNYYYNSKSSKDMNPIFTMLQVQRKSVGVFVLSLQGIHFAVAAGNENMDACKTSPAGSSKV